MGKITLALKHIGAALAVKFVFYFIVSAFFIWFMKWGEIIQAFSWKYVFVLTVGLLLFSVMFKLYIPEKKRK